LSEAWDSNNGSELIRQGNIDDAFLMDVDDIRSKFGNKYDDAILQAMDRIPSIDDLP
jgi:filamentous hemagglutinin